MLSTMRSSNSIRPSYSAATVRHDSRKSPSDELHDVRLVDRGHLLPPVRDRVFERKARDPLRCETGDDLDALRSVLADPVLDARVEVLGVLADDDEIHVLVARVDALDRLRWAKVGVQVEGLAKGDVDRSEAFADGRRDRTLQGDLGLADGIENRFRERRPMDGNLGFAGIDATPLELHAGRVQDGDRGIGKLGPDAVTGYQRDCVGQRNLLAQITASAKRESECMSLLDSASGRGAGGYNPRPQRRSP